MTRTSLYLAIAYQYYRYQRVQDYKNVEMVSENAMMNGVSWHFLSRRKTMHGDKIQIKKTIASGPISTGLLYACL